MRKRGVSTVALSLLLLAASACTASAQSASTVTGFLELDRRVHLGSGVVGLADSYNRFRPRLIARPSGTTGLVASLEVRFGDRAAPGGSAPLTGLEQHYPTEISIWEGFVQTSGLLLPGLDLRIGKQRIQWGTADGFNPSDQVNARDLTDLTDFTRRVPTWAFLADWYTPAGRLSLVWAPYFHGPLLPSGTATVQLFAGAMPSPSPAASPTSIGIELPDPSVRNAIRGGRFSTYALGLDLSVGYLSGFDAMPLPVRVDVTPDAGTGPSTALRLGFARTRTLSADLAGTLAGGGFWWEGALVYPEQVRTRTVVHAGDDSLLAWKTALSDRPFPRTTLGVDYTLEGGWYLNGQWVHGLFLEQGPEAIHDYFFLRIEKVAASGAVKFTLGGAVEVPRWSAVRESAAGALLPEVTWDPMDALAITAGAFLLDGPDGSLLGAWGGFDQAYLRVRLDF